VIVPEAGRQVHQALWVAAALALLGSLLLVFPYPFLALSGASPAVAEKVRGYLLALAFSLPASLLFTVYRGFNVAVSRPKAVMVLQVAALGLKLPLSTLLVFGWPALGLPALGVVGCGIATCVAMWAQVLAALWLLRRDRFYADFQLFGRGLDRPHGVSLRQFLRLGLPMGAAILVEVTGFAFMAIFIARLGTTPVAGHQLAANLVSMLFMMPLALANATGTLVAQRIGAGDAARRPPAGLARPVDRLRRGGPDGRAVFAAREPVLGLYTSNAAVIAAALPLVAWMAVFHVADAAQTVAAFVLRAYKVATVPVLIYVAALWGVGLGGGYGAGLQPAGQRATRAAGAPGFWVASTTGLVHRRRRAQCRDAAPDAARRGVSGRGRLCRHAPSGDAHANHSFNPRRVDGAGPGRPARRVRRRCADDIRNPASPTTAVRKPSRVVATAPAVAPAVAARPLPAPTPCPPAPRPPACWCASPSAPGPPASAPKAARATCAPPSSAPRWAASGPSGRAARTRRGSPRRARPPGSSPQAPTAGPTRTPTRWPRRWRWTPFMARSGLTSAMVQRAATPPRCCP
jgi:MATE family multidrug resistance protein